MLRRSFLFATGATLCAAGFARADAGAYGPSLAFVAHRNGQRIGTHVLLFREEAGRQTVTTQADFTVHMLGFAAYRYRHHAHEVWSDGRFQAIVTETDDNSERYAVQAQREGPDLVVRRREPRSFFKTSGGDEAFEQQRWIHEVQPGHILPSTLWNIAQIRQRELLNTQTGKISHITVSEVGRETVRTATEAPPATRYAYGGDFHMNQWFDDHGRWVKATFEAAADGSTIEYTLQG
jgi:hypothetical protein